MCVGLVGWFFSVRLCIDSCLRAREIGQPWHEFATLPYKKDLMKRVLNCVIES